MTLRLKAATGSPPVSQVPPPSSLPAEEAFQTGLHLRPLAIENAVINRVAHIAVPHHHVISQYPLADGAQALNGALRLFVATIGFQRNADGTQFFKRMAQQQVLALGVHGCTLKIATEPGGTNLNRAVAGADIQIA